VSLQTLIVAGIVSACGLYSVWSLMPSAWRMRLATGLLARLQGHPTWQPAWLRRAAKAPGGCASGGGCSGCDSGSAPKPGQPQVIRIQRGMARPQR
jgi:hypothetical protein